MTGAQKSAINRMKAAQQANNNKQTSQSQRRWNMHRVAIQ